MPYCPNCGVEIGAAPTCPLCGSKNPLVPASLAEPEPPADGGEKAKMGFLGSDSLLERFTPEESRKIVWEVISVAFAIGVVSLLGINILVSGRLSWALYPIATFVFIWIVATAVLAVRRAPKTRIFLAAVAPPLYLLALGFFTGDPAWAWKLAVPIAVFMELLSLSVTALVALAPRKGLNVIAYVLIGTALACLGIEAFVDLYLRGAISLGWSAIAALALVPVAGFLLYLHYRVAKSTNLHRLFKL